ncbi:hypothetical protein [Zobellella denitrificans]
MATTASNGGLRGQMAMAAMAQRAASHRAASHSRMITAAAV